jgi:uncharacterized protein with HEPN domain
VKRSHLARLADILDAIDSVADMMAQVDFAAYRTDKKLRRAIERYVEIVSEAARHIPDWEKRRFPDQPWPEIVAIGNLLRHEYNRVDDLIMWKIATRSLPALRSVIVDMRSRAE